MRTYAYSLATVGIAACVAVFALNQSAPSTQLYQAFTEADNQFLQYVAEFGKRYGTKEEFEFRSEQFKAKFALIQ
jgi:hypothetical protein